MPTLELHQPFETTEPRLRVENILLPGRHRFRLIVVDDDGIESDPVDTLVTIVAPLARSDVVARASDRRSGRAARREARRRARSARTDHRGAPRRAPSAGLLVRRAERRQLDR